MKHAARNLRSHLRPSRQLLLGLALAAASAALYAVHYAVFRDAHHIVFWSLTSLAFLPISVLLVTLIITGCSHSGSSKRGFRSSTW